MDINSIIRGELIGLNVNVVGRSIQGKIIDETKNTFTIKTKNNSKRVVKIDNFFEFTVDNKKIKVDGKILSVKPEERIKLKIGEINVRN